ncbi:hypothetical protein AAHA92_22600 [Salvia divinorum]|uniref:DUF8040 domain-containing protein n=1 Tax=Salvia divinorum TaxID=28513 RepID=A0ABD1GP77_SALDI
MRPPTTNHDRLYMLLEDIMLVYRIETTVLIHRYMSTRSQRCKRRIIDHARKYSVLSKIPAQLKHLDRLVNVTNADCVANLRMDRNTFGRLCRILIEQGGLQPGKFLGIEEQVAIFIGVLAHHKKNRVVGFDFWRSGPTISHYVNKVLGVVLSLHPFLLAKPTPVAQDSNDPRWKWFKGCLGALDGTHKPRYRSRKGQIATNTLAVCDRKMQFVYLLPSRMGGVRW